MMKKLCFSVVKSIMIASLLLSLSTSIIAAERVNVAMVLWRGATKAEEGFQSKLREDKNYEFDFTILDANQSKERLNHLIDNMDRNKYRLIYSFGTTVTKTLKSKIKDKPIVFNIVSRPVKAKVINSWDHSGSNLTGASNAVPMASAFRTLAKVLHIKKLGFIYNPREANSLIQRDEILSLEKRFNYKMVDAPINDINKIKEVIVNILNEKVDAVLLPSDSLIKASADLIIPELNKHKIPSIVSIPAMVKDNHAFIGLGPDYYELGKMAADKALQILAGKKPNDIPSSTLPRLHMTVNLKTAKQIGKNVPVQILRISTVVRD